MATHSALLTSDLRSAPARGLKASLWPNGEFKVWQPRSTPRSRRENLAPSYLHPLAGIQVFRDPESGYQEVLLPSRGADGRPESWQEFEFEEIGWWRSHPAVPVQGDILSPSWPKCDYVPCPLRGNPIDLILIPNSEKVRRDTKIRGWKGITSHGRRLVRNAAELIEQERRPLTFATLTMPGDAAQLIEISNHLDEIKRAVIRGLTYHLSRAGLPGHIVAVWELQSRRLKNHGQPGWHLHLIFPGKLNCRAAWAIAPSILRDIWKNQCSKLVPSMADLEWGGSCDLKPAKSGCSKYLGKYMSKGSAAVAAAVEVLPDIVPPSSWYAITAPIRKLISKGMIRGMAIAWHLCLSILDSKLDCEYLFELISPIFRISERADPIPIGWVGKLSSSELAQVKFLFEENV